MAARTLPRCGFPEWRRSIVTGTWYDVLPVPPASNSRAGGGVWVCAAPARKDVSRKCLLSMHNLHVYVYHEDMAASAVRLALLFPFCLIAQINVLTFLNDPART